MRDIAAGGDPVGNRTLAARVLLRTPAGGVLMWSVPVPVPMPTACAAVLRRLALQTAADPRVSLVEGRCVDAWRA